MILICSFSITAFAATASATLDGVPSELKKEATATVTVRASGTPTSSSALVQVALDDGLELVSGEWKKDGIMKDFTVSNGYGVLALSSAGTLDGTVFSFVIKGKTISSTEQSINITLTFKNGSSTVGTASVSKSVKVVCSSHSYDSWSNVSANQHEHVCTACGHIETANHTWNSGTITKQASCKEEGNKKFTCTACGAEKNETIAKTNSHSWSGYTITKQPTCTTSGTQTRTCSVCGKTETQAISALGHSMGNWVQSKAPTCTSKGEEKRSCSKCGHSETRAINALGHSFSNPKITKEPTCTESGIETGKCTRCGQETTNTIKPTGHKFGVWEDVKKATCTEGGTQKRVCSKCKTEETRNTDALGHDFDNPTVVKEATISSTGLMEGKCKRCGEATQEVISCTAKDDITGISFETSEGVFSEGTQITTEEIKSDNANYGSVKNLLSEITGKFSAYNISASLNGAEVQPNGEVKVTFNIPDGFGNDVALYAISEDGKSEQIEATVSEDGKTISATISNFGTYAICKLGSDNSEDSSDVIDNIDSNNEEKSKNNMIWIIIAVIAVVLIAGAVTTLILVKKKKSDNPDDLGMFL